MDEDFLDVTSSGNKLIALVLILIVVGFSVFGYFFVFQKFHFALKTVNYEIGEEISQDVNTYLKKSVIDTSGYKLDLSRVKNTEVGTYSYKVTYNNRTKKGVINVKDTTPPEFTVKELKVEVGDDNFYLGNALETCEDASMPCLVSFKNDADESKLNTPGTYEITILVADLYNNHKETNIRLTVVPEGELKTSENTDLEFAKSSSETPNFNGEYYIKLEKALEDESEEVEDLIEEISTDMVDEYVKNNYSGYTVKNTEIVKMYNKDGYVIGIVVKVTISDGSEKIIYMTK